MAFAIPETSVAEQQLFTLDNGDTFLCKQVPLDVLFDKVSEQAAVLDETRVNIESLEWTLGRPATGHPTPDAVTDAVSAVLSAVGGLQFALECWSDKLADQL